MTLAKLIDAHVVFVFLDIYGQPMGWVLVSLLVVESPQSLAHHGFQSWNKSHDGQAADTVSFTTSKMLRDKPKQTFKVIRSCELRVLLLKMV